MKRQTLTGKKYFYALGQKVRAWGWPKDAGMEHFKIEAGSHYARIAFDAGFRGLRMN